MFSKEEFYEDYSDLDNIQEAEGYEGVDGLIRIISESYENEIICLEYMNKQDRKEQMMIQESASEYEISSFVEYSVGGVFQFLKGVLQRFWAKIKAVIMRFIRKIQLWFAKSKLKDLKSKAGKFDKFKNRFGTDSLADNTDEKFKEKFGAVTLSDKTTKDVTAKFADKWNGETLTNCPKLDAGGSFNYDDIAADIDEDTDLSDVRDGAFKKFIGIFLKDQEKLSELNSYESFKDDLKEACKIDAGSEKAFCNFLGIEYNNLSGDNAITGAVASKYCDSTIKKLQKFMKNIQKSVDKGIKSVTKKAHMSDSSDELKRMNKAVSLCNSFCAKCISGIFSVTMKHLNDYAKAFRWVCNLNNEPVTR